MLQCVILAGGIGSRMRPTTEEMPKALLPVLDRPFADWQLELLAGQGVERVLYSIGHKGEMLREHVGDGSRWGLAVSYVDEGTELRGTGGALRRRSRKVRWRRSSSSSTATPTCPLTCCGRAGVGPGPTCPALMTVFRNEGRWDRATRSTPTGR